MRIRGLREFGLAVRTCARGGCGSRSGKGVQPHHHLGFLLLSTAELQVPGGREESIELLRWSPRLAEILQNLVRRENSLRSRRVREEDNTVDRAER